MGLDFDFASELVLDLVLLELLFEDDLEGHNEFGPLLPRHVHISEAPLAQLASNFEIVQAPRLLGRSCHERMKATAR
jgi:hypothetical protein